jgi:hypothetical protein|tara:strand:- start:802 stop:1017 length:216 start_codon:yes stop_codon:yes gene_type:complete
MITFLAILILAAILIIFISQQVDADIYVQPIVGLMFGALYSKENLEDDLVQYTMQCCIAFMSLTIIWIEKK